MTKFLTLFIVLFCMSYHAKAQIIFSESFDGTAAPSGFTNTATTGPGWTFSTFAGYDVAATLDHTGNGGNYAWIDFSGTDVGVILELPVVNVSALTNPYIEFYLESHYTGTLTPFNLLFLEAFDGTSWNIVNTFQGNTPFGWDKYDFSLAPYVVAGNVQLRFRGESGGAGNDFNNDILLDDIAIFELPTCPQPTTLSSSNVTFNSADLAWVEVGTATNWEVEYGPVGFTQGTGTIVPAAANPFTLTGLMSNTDYSFFIRSVCTPGDSSFWSGPSNFSTPCVNAAGDDASDAIAINTLPYIDLNYTDSCYSDATGFSAPDIFYQMVVPDCIDSFTVSLCGSNFDTYLRIYANNGTTQLDFNNDGANCNGGASELAIDVRNDPNYSHGDTIYIVVEGTGLATTGNIILQVNTVESTTRSTISPLGCGSYTSPSGKIWTMAGTYQDTIPNAVGCDSIITINLSIGNDNASTISPLGCDSYTSPSGKIWTIAGMYQDTIPNASGCDSIITINLTMGATTTDSFATTACDSYTSPSGKIWTMAGIYQDTIPNASGCDSIITINLTMNNSSATTINPVVCYSYTSRTGRILTTSNTYSDTLTNAVGCDSIITINLIVNNATTATISPLACDSFVSPSGKVWLTSGNYQDTITNQAGCDSIITINLTVTNIDPTVVLNGWTLTANETNANYQWINCGINNASIFGMNAQSFEPSVDGSYAVMITKNGCMETSTCVNVTGVSITEVAFDSNVQAYPNPTEGEITIDLGKVYEDVSVKIMTTTGQVVSSKMFTTTNQFELAVDGTAGLYILEIQTKTGERAIIKVTKW